MRHRKKLTETMNDTPPITDAAVPSQKRIRWRLVFAICLGALGALFLVVLLVTIPIAILTMWRSTNEYGLDVMLKWMREEDRMDDFLVLPFLILQSIGLLFWAYGLWKNRRRFTWTGFLLVVICGIAVPQIEKWF